MKGVIIAISVVAASSAAYARMDESRDACCSRSGTADLPTVRVASAAPSSDTACRFTAGSSHPCGPVGTCCDGASLCCLDCSQPRHGPAVASSAAGARWFERDKTLHNQFAWGTQAEAEGFQIAAQSRVVLPPPDTAVVRCTVLLI